MQRDFHYYATYCAAYLAGHSHEDAVRIAYAAAMVDFCSKDYLTEIGAPLTAATTQLQLEMMEAWTDKVGRQEITSIWAAFHFLPGDLKAEVKRGGKRYKDKYRMICGTNGELLQETVKLAAGEGLEAVGLAMHVLADTWAHQYFAGTPSMVINNTNYYFYELIREGEKEVRRKVTFRHNPTKPDDIEQGIFTNTLGQISENSVMNLGHGRAGHLPDYSFIRYAYLPAWGDYREIIKDNPSDFYHAFGQMIYAMKSLREEKEFQVKTYDFEAFRAYEEEVRAILSTRSVDSDLGWKTLGEKLSGKEIPDFDMDEFRLEYTGSPESDRENTVLGRFIRSAIRQKEMLIRRVAESGNPLAGTLQERRKDR